VTITAYKILRRYANTDTSRELTCYGTATDLEEAVRLASYLSEMAEQHPKGWGCEEVLVEKVMSEVVLRLRPKQRKDDEE